MWDPCSIFIAICSKILTFLYKIVSQLNTCWHQFGPINLGTTLSLQYSYVLGKTAVNWYPCMSSEDTCWLLYVQYMPWNICMTKGPFHSTMQLCFKADLPLMHRALQTYGIYEHNKYFSSNFWSYLVLTLIIQILLWFHYLE